eukprot:2444578-Prorocentrum_lima.AAC.1
MTSSLVGSEMCIRDRPNDGWVLRSCCVLQGSGGPGHRGVPHLPGHDGLCLLYTSDAADDM